MIKQVEAFLLRRSQRLKTMAPEILYLSDEVTGGDPAIGALEAAGYEVVSTDSSNQAIALFFVMRSLPPLCFIRSTPAVKLREVCIRFMPLSRL